MKYFLDAKRQSFVPTNSYCPSLVLFEFSSPSDEGIILSCNERFSVWNRSLLHELAPAPVNKMKVKLFLQSWHSFVAATNLSAGF